MFFFFFLLPRFPLKISFYLYKARQQTCATYYIRINQEVLLHPDQEKALCVPPILVVAWTRKEMNQQTSTQGTVDWGLYITGELHIVTDSPPIDL